MACQARKLLTKFICFFTPFCVSDNSTVKITKITLSPILMFMWTVTEILSEQMSWIICMIFPPIFSPVWPPPSSHPSIISAVLLYDRYQPGSVNDCYELFLRETWSQQTASFWAAAHVVSQGSVPPLEKSTICPLQHRWAHWCPQLWLTEENKHTIPPTNTAWIVMLSWLSWSTLIKLTMIWTLFCWLAVWIIAQMGRCTGAPTELEGECI